MNRPDPVEAARRIHAERYPEADVIFLAGSVMRGEGTATSDLDIVVVYKELKHAWRESFVFEGWPVEAFVHDPATAAYFFEEVDRASGFPFLPRMVDEGFEIPTSTAISTGLKQKAKALLLLGPPALTSEKIAQARYGLSDLLDDLRAPKNNAEIRAMGVRLYEELADFYLRSRGLWSAKAKHIPRALMAADPAFAGRFEAAFADLFEEGGVSQAIGLAEEALAPTGGILFEGFKLNAPDSWRC